MIEYGKNKFDLKLYIHKYIYMYIWRRNIFSITQDFSEKRGDKKQLPNDKIKLNKHKITMNS